MFILNKLVIILWVLLAMLNSVDFDIKSMVIWTATVIIAMSQIELITQRRLFRFFLRKYRKNKQR